MNESISQLESSASSVNAIVTSKAVVISTASLGAGEIAKTGGGWMITSFFLGVNTVQLCQLIAAVYMLIMIYKYFDEKKKITKVAKRVQVIQAGGDDKPKPR
jgi:hypothetical protein